MWTHIWVKDVQSVTDCEMHLLHTFKLSLVNGQQYISVFVVEIFIVGLILQGMWTHMWVKDVQSVTKCPHQWPSDYNLHLLTHHVWLMSSNTLSYQLKSKCTFEFGVLKMFRVYPSDRPTDRVTAKSPLANVQRKLLCSLVEFAHTEFKFSRCLKYQ